MTNPALLNANDYVRIINDSDEVIEGRYAGIDYTFRIGEAVDVPLVVAHHIFGLGGTDQHRANCLARLGWVRTMDDVKGAMKRLGRIRFEELPNVIELVPRNKTSRAGPLGVGGSEGTAAGASALPVPEDPLAEDQIDEPVIGERI